MFYAEIGVLAERIGTRGAGERDPLPPLPEGWENIPNSAVLKALHAERKLASGRQDDVDAGLALLREAITDTDARIEAAGSPIAERHPAPARGGAGHTHRNTYYRIVLALLRVRLGRALAALGGHDAEAEQAFDLARCNQPMVLSYVNQEAARFLLSRGREDEADAILRTTRSIKTMAADIELAVAQSATAPAAFDNAYAKGELRKLLPRVERISSALARFAASADPAARSQAADLTAWHAKALVDHARVLGGLGEHARAARTFKTSAEIYAADARLLGSAMVVAEFLGDEQVTQGVAAGGYAWGLDRWRLANLPEKQRDQAMRLAGKCAIASLTAEVGELVAAYADEFDAYPGGPCVALSGQGDDDPLLGDPAIARRLRLVFDRMLREAKTIRRTRDLALAQLTLFARGVPATDFPPDGAGEKIIRPWLQGIRLELDVGLLGPVKDPAVALIGRAKRVRESLQSAWGVQLPGIRMTDSALGQRGYQISLAGHIVETGEIPITPPTAEAGRQSFRRKPAGEPVPAPDALAPDAERVFARLEAVVAERLWMTVGHGALPWLQQHHRQLPREDELDLDEEQAAAFMAPSLAVVQSLLHQRLKLLAFPAFNRCLRAGIAAGKPPAAIVEDIRRLPEVSAALWGAEPGRALFRLSAADAARVGGILAGNDPAARAWLRQALMALVTGLPADACLVVPFAALRGPIQDPAFLGRLDLPVLAAEELPTGRLASATLLALPAQPVPPPQPALPAAAPPALGSATTLRRLVEREAERRGLHRAARHGIFREAAAAARRGEDAAYAVELALDEFAPASVDLRGGTEAFAKLESWAAARRLDAYRLAIYRPTGVLLPPLRLLLDDTLAPDAWVIGFNTRTNAMPPVELPELERAITAALHAELHAFVGNRQVERLLHRLGQDNRLGRINRLLPANVLEIYRMPDIVAFLRQLVQQRRSIRSLQTIMEVLLLYQKETAAERFTRIASALAPF